MQIKHGFVAGVALLALGCSSDETDVFNEDAQEVTANYAELVHRNYEDAVTAAEDLHTAIHEFVESPSEQTLRDARDAWLEARESYGQSEGYRFYDGPIDNTDTGPEGRINAWPLDEAYIDYVDGAATAGVDGGATTGIINDTENFPELTVDVIVAQNEQGGEKNISTGYHAIEFLLWGQDHSADGPGDRPYTDYVTGSEGTAENQARRATYLTLVADLLIDDLSSVADEWKADENNYREDFVAGSRDDALSKMLTGIGSLAGAELAGERMTTALDNRDQEDEHSCFSDNTHRDLYLNALSVQNVYLGNYDSDLDGDPELDGPGINDLVVQLDPQLNQTVHDQLDASLEAIQDIHAPFDQELATAAGRARIDTAIRALQDLTESLADVAAVLDVEINLE